MHVFDSCCGCQLPCPDHALATAVNIADRPEAFQGNKLKSWWTSWQAPSELLSPPCPILSLALAHPRARRTKNKVQLGPSTIKQQVLSPAKRDRRAISTHLQCEVPFGRSNARQHISIVSDRPEKLGPENP